MRTLKGALSTGVLSDLHRGITQRCAALYLGAPSSFFEWLQELVFARRLERVMSKPQLMTLFTNHSVFVPGARGIEAAASRVFRRSAGELSPEQVAQILGLDHARRHELASFGTLLDYREVRSVIQRAEALFPSLPANAILTTNFSTTSPNESALTLLAVTDRAGSPFFDVRIPVSVDLNGSARLDRLVTRALRRTTVGAQP